jgi:hypothetical protein
MASYVGPNGRLYHRASRGKAIGLTILAVTLVGMIVIGQHNMRSLIAYVGL